MTISRNYVESTVAVTSVEATAVPQNRDRMAIVFFNVGATEILIGIGTAQIPIASKGHLALMNEMAPINLIKVKTASGTSSLVVWEA